MPTMHSTVGKRPHSFNPNCTLHILSKALRRHFPAEDEVRRYKDHLTHLLRSYVALKAYMLDKIVCVGKHFATLLKHFASRNRRIFLTAQKDLTHVKALAEAQDLYHTGESVLDAFKLTCMLGRNGTDDDWRVATRDEHVALREGRNIRANWEEWMA